MTENQGYRPPDPVVDELSSSRGRPIEDEPTEKWMRRNGLLAGGGEVGDRRPLVRRELEGLTLNHTITATGPYDAILRQVKRQVTRPDSVARLELMRVLTSKEPGLRDGASPYLDWSRLTYALHLLTGPALVRLAASYCHVDDLTSREVDAAMDWRVFEQHLSHRWDALNSLTRSPVPALLRTTLFNGVEAMRNDDRGWMLSNIESAITQFCEVDAAGTEMMIDLAVACLVPPVATKGGLN